jgi:P-type Ca2+ transporter type 2C
LRVGLSQREAELRLAREGHNDLPERERSSGFAVALEVMREPMFFLLIGAAVLYAVIGSLAEACVLAAFATVSVSIAIVQRGRSERVLDALRDLTSPRALVIRDGEHKRIAGRDVARGDLLVVAEGDRVAADALLVQGSDIRVDESLLTGESVPVCKRVADAGAPSPAAPGGDDLPYLFSGTLILRGTGLAAVTATGIHSEIGKIGRTVIGIDQEQPRLQAQTRRLVLLFGAVGMTLSSMAVLLYGFLRGDWLRALLGGIALGMSLLPEEFPLVLTVFMAMGAWRLSRSRVLTRRAAAIETLGSATVLCTDKTGTLTCNAMSIMRLQSADDEWRPDQAQERVASSASLATLLETAVLASETQALDPMERAIHELATRTGLNGLAEKTLVQAFPLRPELFAITQLWGEGKGGSCVVASKGAPEAIARLCRMGPEETSALLCAVNRLAQQGMRVLGAARGVHEGPSPASALDLSLRFAGLIALADPLRKGVPKAVRECRSAGIRVVMITGDYPETARAIALEAGLADGVTLTGRELDQLDDPSLASRIRDVTVFARITPNQKLRIVQALKTDGEVVAMTGDGVNDAPALKAAHIGIAMGGRGTDVAREASSIVLLDDDFSSIVVAIRLGRRIYDNLRKATGYILAIHLPIAGLALLPILLGWPLLLTPMLIAFLELIIDPACSIVLEAEHEEPDIMQRPPRNSRSPLVSAPLAAWSVMQGLLAFLVIVAVYVGAYRRELPEDEVRALAFVALVGANFALIIVSRTFRASLLSAIGRPNASLAWGLGLVVGLLALMLGWPAARGFFGLGPLHPDDLLLCAAVAIGLLLLLQFLKRFWQARLFA